MDIALTNKHTNSSQHKANEELAAIHKVGLLVFLPFLDLESELFHDQKEESSYHVQTQKLNSRLNYQQRNIFLNSSFFFACTAYRLL